MNTRTTNPWRNPSAGEAAQLASFLEERSAYPDQEAVNATLIEIAGPQPGERFLDLGCGAGGLTRRIAERVEPGGCATGLDLSPAMLAGARELQGYAPRLDAAGTAYALPFPAGAFDAALAARLLLHLQRPQAAVAEMARVVRSGGRIVLMDWDFETLALDHSDRELTRQILHWRCDYHGGDNWSGRQLYRRLKTAGLRKIDVRAVASVVQERKTSLAQSVLRCAHRALEGGGISMEAYISWTEELEERLRTGIFFASILYFIGVGIVD